jgi:hypothetical protein
MRPLLILVLLMCAGLASTAQQAGTRAATLSGQVLDPVGDPVPGADILLSPQARVSTSDSNGRFLLGGISPGAYTLTVSAYGFTTSVSPMALQAGAALELSAIHLGLASMADTVSVTASQHDIAERYFAGLADYTSGTYFAGAIFPALFHQDPRYFVQGTGSRGSRILYAIDSAVLCRGDNGRRQVNFAGIAGGLAASGLSNLYYPASDRHGATLTFENLGIGIVSDAIASLIQEFLLPRFTTHKPAGNPKATTQP